VKVYGEDLEMLSSYAGKIGKIIPSIVGAKDLYVEKVTGLPQIVIKYKRDQIAKFGMNIEDINQTVNAAFAGQSAGLVYEGEKRFDLVVRLDRNSRANIEDVADLYVSTPKGVQVPLQQVADVSFVVGPNQIQRDDAKRRITIGFNVRGRDVESVVNELQKKIGKQIKFAPGYYPSYGGTFKNLQEARTRLSIAVPAALMLILLLLYFTFSSLKQGLLIFTAIPLSAIGGVLALWSRDMPFSISAGVGFIALFGVAVLNGIVLVGEFNRLKKDGVEDIIERIRLGTSVRLRPVIMTAAVASLGFLPMALSHGSGAEVQKPLATVVIGGLVTATFLTLVVLPCIYLLAERKMKRSNPVTPIASIILLFVMSSLNGYSQTKTLSLDSALSVAERNNKNLQAVALQKDYFKYQKGTSTELPKTDVSLTYGQYNSFYKQDNNITVSQVIPLPTLFSAKSALASSHIKSSELQTANTRNELALQVKQVYYTLQYLELYKQLLQRLDSLNIALVKAADLRYKTGEGTLLEKTSAGARANEVKNKLRQADAEISIHNARLQSLLGVTYGVSVKQQGDTERAFTLNGDSSSFKGNLYLAYVRQQIDIAQKERSVITNASLPELKFGYFNQTLYGVPLSDANVSFARPSDRFQGFLVGIIFPLWFVPEIKRSQAAQTQVEINKKMFESEQLHIQSLYNQSVQTYMKAKANLDYYKNSALPDADLILKQAETSYSKGEIGYTQQVISLQQAASIREGYLQALNEYNQSVITLEFITASK
jgi:cobalt-zinc-cadmium resistance protein CzcA